MNAVISPIASDDREAHHRRYTASTRRYRWACLALLLLLAATAAIARVHLGLGNLAASLGIAFIKALIVAWVFMSLRDEPGFTRLVAAVGVVALLILGSLSLVDFGPRRGDEAVRYQSPQWVPPVLAQPHPAAPAAPPKGDRP
jgi:cytochrome c oxidase subunit 4